MAALLRRLSVSGLLGLSLALAGCGVGTVSTETAGSLAISGAVHGGVQPIVGATIQLFAVGTGGNGSQAASLLARPVVTDSHSYFSLTGDYTCPSADTQVYLAARGGNPGFSGSVSNPALVLLSALGSCGNLISNPNRFLSVNEVTTVAAVYALAPFTSAFDHIGASATNTSGISNAFLNAQLLADTSTGMAPQLASNLSVESAKLYALADAIVPCVNSTGNSAACSPLFTAATVNGVAPTDVLGALLNIVKHPGTNVAAVFGAIGSTPPYPTTLTAAPHDWTMSLNVRASSLFDPTDVAIDRYGNVWVTNFGTAAADAGLLAFTPQGSPFPGIPYGAGLQTEAYAMALDKNGDVWVASRENRSSGTAVGTVAKFQGAEASTPGALLGQFQDSTIQFPTALATDPAGNGTLLIANYNRGSVTYYDLNGTFQKSVGQNAVSFPISVTSDNAGGAWVGNYDNYVTHILANGTTQNVTCCYVAQSVKLDRESDVWIANYIGIGRNQQYTFSEVAPSGSVLIYEQSGGGLYSPAGGAVDAGGQFWVANYNAIGSITEVAGNESSSPGAFLSPSTGFGLDAQLCNPFGIAPDPSGNLWVSSRNGNRAGANSLTMFFGVATPTATPATPLPQVP